MKAFIATAAVIFTLFSISSAFAYHNNDSHNSGSHYHNSHNTSHSNYGDGAYHHNSGCNY